MKAWFASITYSYFSEWGSNACLAPPRRGILFYLYPNKPRTACGKELACANMLVALCTMI